MHLADAFIQSDLFRLYMYCQAEVESNELHLLALL